MAFINPPLQLSNDNILKYNIVQGKLTIYLGQ